MMAIARAIFVSLVTSLVVATAQAEDRASYDFSSFRGESVESLDVCFSSYEPDITTRSGHRVKMLGAAFVYFGPSNGQSVMGHVAERFVYCRDEQLFDVLYDYAPLGQNRLDHKFEEKHGVDLAAVEAEFPEYRQKLANSLYVEMIFEPVKYYSLNQFFKNRSVYEAWFDIDPQTMYKMLLSNVDRYNAQEEKIKNREDLPEYKTVTNNCMEPVKEDLAIINPGYLWKFSPARLTPGLLYEYVRKRNVSKVIVYPSQRLFRILRMKEDGRSTAFENIAPLSKASKNANGTSWELLYPESDSRFARAIISPIAGVVNMTIGVVETAFGIVTLPLSWLVDSKYFGKKRIVQGMGDILAALPEVVWFRIRYPHATEWSDEERSFFQELSQQSVLLEYMKSKYSQSPILIKSDEIVPEVSAESPPGEAA